MKGRISTGVALAAFALGAGAQPVPVPTPAFAAPNLSPAGARALAATCSPCHGTAGRPAPGASLPALAGRPAAEIIAPVADYRDGRRPATLMNQIARGFSDAEVAAIAEYFSRQPR